MQSKDDNIYKNTRENVPFQFNEQVASVFPDMIGRSVPGYHSVINMIEQLAGRYVRSNTNCYDLGCSLGEATLALENGISSNNVTINAIDNSPAMLDKCQLYLDCYKHRSLIKLKCEDIRETMIENASMVVLNYTLQFIGVNDRNALIKSIFNGMNSGAILLISEKISVSNQLVNDLFIDLHHQFKKDNGYSSLEISQKRNALENVLIPETLDTHIERLKKAGFNQINCWQQHLNFASMIAIKE